MAYMFGRVTVDDYAAFRKTFDSKDDMRRAAGALNSTVYQSVDDPNEIIVQVEFPTADAARAFLTSEALRNAMQQAGVQGQPRTLVVDET